ncbi:MAG: glycoside hydrolase [Ignavibacteriae bacterium HGW-Ignavibacteriae-2]|nr:MAG: glycoside hydrolase [Ignavibacteriae bacterium HGW-Ignavibacteriae-2]
MKLKLIYILLFFSFYLFAQEKTNMDILQNKILEIKNQFAPDKRVAVFEIEITVENDLISLTGKTNLPEAKNKLMEISKEITPEIEDKIITLPSKDLGEKIYGIVNLSVANIRSKPNHPEELATQALLGTPVKVLENHDGFYRVQTPDGYIAWVDEDGIEQVNHTELMSWLNSKKIIYLADFGFLYKSTANTKERVSDLVLGDILKFVGDEGEFYKVEFPDARQGYVEKSFASDFDGWFKSINADGEKITSTAETFMGIPYLWGGTSAKAMDCSGFTKTVYFINGIILPRDASQQVHSGELVNTENGFNDLQPGDLLFFGRKASEGKPEKVTHVAIYKGNLEYIHASGRIKINSFDQSKDNYSKYRHSSFIRAKRILTSLNKNGISSISDNKFYTGDF